MKLIDKVLVDGGFGFTNNPSFATYEHYFLLHRKAYEQIKFVNIGTGSRPCHLPAVEAANTKKGWRERLKIGPVHTFNKLLRKLQEMATNSDKVGAQMEVVQDVGDTVKFVRFSADKKNLHEVQLHEWKRNKDIREATDLYIKEGKIIRKGRAPVRVKDALQKTARELAEIYLARVREGRKPLPGSAVAVNQDHAELRAAFGILGQREEVSEFSSGHSREDEYDAPENTRATTPTMFYSEVSAPDELLRAKVADIALHMVESRQEPPAAET